MRLKKTYSMFSILNLAMLKYFEIIYFVRFVSSTIFGLKYFTKYIQLWQQKFECFKMGV